MVIFWVLGENEIFLKIVETSISINFRRVVLAVLAVLAIIVFVLALSILALIIWGGSWWTQQFPLSHNLTPLFVELTRVNQGRNTIWCCPAYVWVLEWNGRNSQGHRSPTDDLNCVALVIFTNILFHFLIYYGLH